MGREKQREVEGLGDQEGSYELCGVATRDVGAARRASLRVVVGFAIADVGLRGSFARERWRFHFHIVDVFVFALEVVLLRCRRWQSDPETTSASQNHQADNYGQQTKSNTETRNNGRQRPPQPTSTSIGCIYIPAGGTTSGRGDCGLRSGHSDHGRIHGPCSGLVHREGSRGYTSKQLKALSPPVVVVVVS